MMNTMQSEYRNLPLDALTESPNNPRRRNAAARKPSRRRLAFASSRPSAMRSPFA